MNSHIITACFLRLVTSILSATEAILTRPDEESKIAESGVGGCWTAAFFAFLISIALESRLSKLQRFVPSAVFYVNMFGTCFLYVGVLFFIRMPKTSDGIEGVPAENIWSGFWMTGGLMITSAQIFLICTAKRNSFPWMLTVSYSLGALGSYLYFMSGMLSTTEFINKDIFYFTAMYQWYMNTANVWISASVIYMVHAITLYLGLTKLEEGSSIDDRSEERVVTDTDSVIGKQLAVGDYSDNGEEAMEGNEVPL